MKTFVKVIFSFVFFFAPLLFAPLPASAGLVPCGTTEHPEVCTLCHIIIGGKAIIDWGMGIMVIVGLALLMISGVMYIVSVGDNGRMGTAKGMIEKVLGGLALILCGWLIVNTIIGILASDNMGIGVQKANWYTFTCDSKSSANTSGGSGSVPNNTNTKNSQLTPPDVATRNSDALVVKIPSASPVVMSMSSGSTKHVTLSGNPDFSRGPIAIENVVQVTVVPQNIFSSLEVPVALAADMGMTITPTTITTLEEWRNGLTLSVEAGVADKNMYTVTLQQGNSLLGTIKVNITNTAPIIGGASGGVGTSTTGLSGLIMDSDGRPVQATVYCGDKTRDEDPLSYRSNPNGSVTVSRKNCDAKVPNGNASVWVACPYGVTAVPAEILVSQFNGSTFTCVIPGTAGSLKYMTP